MQKYTKYGRGGRNGHLAGKKPVTGILPERTRGFVVVSCVLVVYVGLCVVCFYCLICFVLFLCVFMCLFTELSYSPFLQYMKLCRAL